MGEGADGDEIDPGFGDPGDGLEIDPAARLEEGSGTKPVPQGDGTPELLVRHVVEEDHVDAVEPEEDLDLVEPVGFELDLDAGMFAADLGNAAGEVHGVGIGDEVIVLHHDGIVEPDAVIRAAPVGDGRLLQFAPAGGGFAGVEETGPGVGDGGGVGAGDGGDAAEPLQEVQDGSFGLEDEPGGTLDRRDEVTLFRRGSVRDDRGEDEGAVPDGLADEPGDGGSGNDAGFPGHDPPPGAVPDIDEMTAREIPGPVEVLLEGEFDKNARNSVHGSGVEVGPRVIRRK